jgi:RimJ/RimL family protein N-acetyltransferase
MRHDYQLQGYAFRLRPVTDADAQLILDLRCDPELSRFLHRTPPARNAQLAWLSAYYDRPGDYYFVVERRRDATPEGLIALYDTDAAAGTAEWGRWILKRGSLAAAESAWLIYRFAFEQLSLARVYCRTVADNAAVVSFHDACGVTHKRRLKQFFELQGHKHDAIEHEVDRQSWPEIAPKLEQPARAVARRLDRG